MRTIELKKLFDKGIWISDSRIAAFISGDGIKQIDYHGLQPVSRNSRMLMHDESAIKIYYMTKKEEKTLVNWNSVQWYPNKVETAITVDGYSAVVHIGLHNSSLLIWMTVEENFPNNDFIKLEIIIDKYLFTKDIHGARKMLLSDHKNEYIILRINDKILLNSWMKEKGAYRGDFMIPEVWRRMIFKNKKISGFAQYDDLKDEYKHDNIFLNDENTFMVFGGESFLVTELREEFIAESEIIPALEENSAGNPFAIVFGTDIISAFQTFCTAIDFSIDAISKKAGYYDNFRWTEPSASFSSKNLESFFALFPDIVNSAEIEEIGMFRACASSYYWIWAWDSMVTMNAVSFCRLAPKQRNVIQFIRRNKSYDGSIPMQWTHNLEPMDSKGFGALDFLFANLITRNYVSMGNFSVIRENYPHLVHSFEKILSSCNDKGLYPSVGFYPDLPEKLGRREESFVSMEIAALYSNAVIMNWLSYVIQDPLIVKKSEDTILLLQKHFLSVFWDDEKGFLFDSIDENGNENQSYPLFALLFILNYSSLSLVRSKIKLLADFIEKNLFDDNGFSLVPKWDKSRKSEDVMNSWYPYWDLLALKIIRRSGNKELIKKWIKLADECFGKFGYCPEFISSEEQKNHHTEKWNKHGTPWNLNCSAGWYQSIVENIFGIEEDIGGITYIPLSPLSEKMKLKKVVLKSSECDIEIKGSGKHVSSFSVNGKIIMGCLKIPDSFYFKGPIKIKITHSSVETPLYFKELNGATVKKIDYSLEKVILDIDCVGFVDILFYSKSEPKLSIDGEVKGFSYSAENKEGYLSLFLYGQHEICLSL